MEFSEPGEKLGTVADGQLWQFFKNLRFAHAANLTRLEFSCKRGVARSNARFKKTCSNPLATKLLAGEFKPNDKIKVTVKDDALVFQKK